jgi:hypothetical protein
MEVMRQAMQFRVSLAIGVAFLATIAMGCSESKVTTKSSSELSRYKVRTIVLMPFASIATPQARDQDGLFLPAPDSVRRSDISLAIPRDVQPPPRQTMTVPGYAAEKVTELFWGRLQDRKGIHVMSPADAVRAASADGELAKVGPEKAATAVAKRLKADAALIGLISVYQERMGSRLGANPPATVGFQAKVVAADGQVLWVGGYYERQRPMNEDLMGFFRGWGFLTETELAEYGVDEILKKFPFGREGDQ